MSDPQSSRSSWLMAIAALLICWFTGIATAGATGTWSTLPVANGGSPIVLSDGSIFENGGQNTMRLIPDAHGSYLNGTWVELGTMTYFQSAYGQDMLQDGRVFEAGSENGVQNTAEIFDPMLNTWTALSAPPNVYVMDSPTMTIADGQVMVGGQYTPQVDFFNPATNSWTQGPSKIASGYGGDNAEVTWVKLPDQTILCIDWWDTTAEKYVPSLNQWVSAGSMPVSVWDGNGEMGPGFVLPNGNAIFFGASGSNVIYTPPANPNNPGTWAAAASFPSGYYMADCPGAMMVNGKILLLVDYNGGNSTAFMEYDPVANSFTVVPNSPTVGNWNNAEGSRMLTLPDGTILVNGTWIYTPDGTPVAAGTPGIGNITQNADGTFLLSGTNINGLSEGGSYGDDAQMASNYPLVKMTSGSNVYYARTYNWSSTGVDTGTTPESVDFSLPLGLSAGTYSLSVVGNGFSSPPVNLTIPTNASDVAPTVATSAAATSGTNDTQTNLSVLGASGNGESTLTYTWTNVAAPINGVATPSFSVNNSNAAKNATATLYAAGTYTFIVYITDTCGLATSSTVTATVSQAMTSVGVSPRLSPDLTAGQSQQFSATASDQFNRAMSSQPSFSWSVASGGGNVNGSGLYTSPGAGTQTVLTAVTGTLAGSGTADVVDSPWASADVGSPGLMGSAYDLSGTFTVSGEGSDIWGTSDQFHYVYRTLGGDGMIIARVAAQQNTGTYPKAGVMIRNSTAANDQFAMVEITPSGAYFRVPRHFGRFCRQRLSNTSSATAPYWLKLVRSGNTFTAYLSANGATWTQDGTATIAMGTQTLIGLAVDSYNGGALNTSTFDHVSIHGRDERAR